LLNHLNFFVPRKLEDKGFNSKGLVQTQTDLLTAAEKPGKKNNGQGHIMDY
jgi:hypothetical protein